MRPQLNIIHLKLISFEDFKNQSTIVNLQSTQAHKHYNSDN